MAEPVLLDVDPGVDDALAILLAVNSPELDLQAVTVVNGNVPLDMGARNAAAVLAFGGREKVPVYRGADRPLARAPMHTYAVHGLNGLGEAVLEDGATPRDGAVEYLVKSLSERPGEIAVAAVGPLTNLALAERMSPGVLARASRIVIMGGAVAVPGNTSAVAEYNFYADPLAAMEVLASEAEIVLVPLDVTRRVGIDAETIATRIAPLDTVDARFFEAATRVVVEYGRRMDGYAGVHLHDPAAVAWLVCPRFFSLERLRVAVEPEGRYTAGQVVVDRRYVPKGKAPLGREIACAMRVDGEAVIDLFVKRTLEGRG